MYNIVLIFVLLTYCSFQCHKQRTFCADDSKGASTSDNVCIAIPTKLEIQFLRLL